MRELNYSVITLNTNEDEETEYKAITAACSRQVDGILLCPCQHSTENITFLNKLEIPYALIGRYFAQMDMDYICADDIKGGYLAGKFLVEKGCRNPVYVGAYPYIEASANRFSGLKRAFAAVNSHLFMPFYSASIGMLHDGWADKAAEVIMNKINGSTDTFHEIIDVKLFEFNSEDK